MTDAARRKLLREAIAELKRTQEGYVTHPNGPHWKRGLAKLERLDDDLAPSSRVPLLGPIYKGGQSVLKYAPTHNTDGLLNFSAFDAAVGPGFVGRPVLAPEAGVCYKQSSAQGGDAFYFRGDSRIEYWVGHVAAAPATGRRFRKGEQMAVIGNTRTPHVHLGLNTIPLCGRPLAYGRNGNGPDYTKGSPTIGVQLAKYLDK